MSFIQTDWIIDRLINHGHKAHYVGGCVRDFYFNHPIHDIDIATSAPIEEIIVLFSEHSLDLHLKHFYVVYFNNYPHISISSYRLEGDYVKHRYPSKVWPTNRLEDDVKRRDFTINAIYKNSYEVIDLTNGLNDIEKKQIVMINDPMIRLQEDALRMYRACRFSAIYDCVLESSLAAAIQHHSTLALLLSQHSRSQEFEKVIAKQDNQILKRYIQLLTHFNLPVPNL